MSERTCGNCGDPEFRIDGYCSIYCRDVHEERMERERLESVLRRLLEAAEKAHALLRDKAVVYSADGYEELVRDQLRALKAAVVEARQTIGEGSS